MPNDQTTPPFKRKIMDVDVPPPSWESVYRAQSQPDFLELPEQPAKTAIHEEPTLVNLEARGAEQRAKSDEHED
jgi:hypothetical protein